MSTQNKLETVFKKTRGHCHFCGDKLIFDKYGIKDYENIKGAWEIDHIFQKGRGGSKDLNNCLPACTKCNRLRWHRKGINLRELIILGLIAVKEINNKTSLGNELLLLKHRRQVTNRQRRIKANKIK